ncbi:MAG: HAMP domain-containing protein [Deltaproteobacteria bacterium]|nr:HAMP domain-containing protein [Deltaproteobacteria bacterium]
MTIRRKTALVLVAAFCVLAVVEALFLSRVVLTSFSALEAEDAARNMERVIRAIESETGHLAAVASDWGAWDDTWRFMKDRNRSYVESNLLENTFSTTGANLIYFVDTEGQVVWSGILTPEDHWIPSLNEFPEKALPKDHPLLCPQWDDDSPAMPGASRSGVLNTQKGPLIAAAQPIVTSNDSGPSRGTIIMGAFLDDRAVRRISEQTRVKFSVLPGSAVFGTGPDPKAETIKAGSRSYTISRTGADRLVVETRLPDLGGKRDFFLTAELDRSLHQRGMRVLAFALFFTLAAFLTCFAAIVILNRRVVLSPITRIRDHALLIEGEGDLSARLNMKRKDEIGALASAFDRMVERVEEMSGDLARANQALSLDIERREEMEETLRRGEEYVRSVFQSMRDEILVIGPGLIVEDANRETLESLGIRRSEVRGLALGRVFGDFLPHCDFAEECGRVAEVFDTSQPHSCRLTVKHPEGALFLDALFSPMPGPEGKVGRVIAAFRDVTFEENLSRKVAAMRKMQAVGALAGGVAHEFNNILMSMLLNIEYCLKKLPPEDSSYDALAMSLESGRRARDLIRELLSFSRGAADAPAVLSVSPVIKETIKIILSTAGRDIRIGFEKTIKNDRVLSTPSAIQQVTANLCNNALWAMRDKGGELFVSLATAEEKDGGDAFLCLVVSDNGPGMPQEVMERIFEPFFTTKNPGEGAGLGLAVVHGLVSEMGGFVKVASKPGAGTTFQVFLPLASEEGAGAEPGELNGGGANILLAEEDGDLGHSMYRLLTGMGHWVSLERNGDEALARILADPSAFDVIVASHALPFLSGLALARELKRRGLSIPVILLKGPDAPPAPPGLDDESVSIIAQKPISVMELERLVVSVVKTP